MVGFTKKQLAELKQGYDPVASRSWSLNTKAYIDAQFFPVEKQAIFHKTWQFVCHIEKLRAPGQYLTIVIYGQSIVVLRDSNHDLRAFYNVCKHRGHELLSGEGQKILIVCPYHAWSYTLEGRLKAARLTEDVENFNQDEICLTSVQVEEFCSLVFVNLDPTADSLAKQSGDLAKEIESYAPDLGNLTFAHRLTYKIQANWKTVVDNFLECYHCPTAHRDFVSLVDMDSYKVTTHGIYSSHMAKAGLSENSAYAVEGASVTDHAVWFLWPNTTLMRYPGRGNFMLWKIIPAGPEETYEEFDFFFETTTPNKAETEAIKYIDEVLQIEDIGLVESVQRGMRTPAFEQGRYVINHRQSGMSEHAVHHFHGLVLDAFEQYCNSEEKHG
jgi:phenylpropionate dioxygenase-like ring-hydroxylating dioxygenase large terminal subunit